MSVAVLIVNFRTPDLTVEAIRSVLSEPEVTEIVVVENGSGDDSFERISKAIEGEMRVTVIKSIENLGFGRGNNLGAEHATADFLFLLNSDATLHAGALSTLLTNWQTLETPGILAPAIRMPDGHTLQLDTFGIMPTAKRLLSRATKRSDPDWLEPDWVSGCAMLLKRADFEAVGGFDSDVFMYYEDVLLCRAIRGLGRTIHRCLEASVTHLGGASASGSTAQKKQYYAAQDVLLSKIGEPVLLRMLVRIARWPNLWIGKLLRR
ncbi:MAG: glycosyltransferase family 2 protein [Fimbriimonadaceae bacterium]